MSGVLDRMAQRALGRLPAVQPLVTPRYAEAHAEPHGLATSQLTAGLEMAAETTAADPGLGHDDARTRAVVEHDPLPQRQGRKAEESLDTRGSVDRPGNPKSATLSPRAPEAILQPRQSQQPEQRAAQVAVERATEVVAEARPVQPVKHGEIVRTPKTVPHLGSTELRRESAKSEAVREERKAPEAVSAPLPQDEIARPEMIRSSEAPKSSRTIVAPPLAVGRRAMQQPERQATEEKPEIHISIGSIELRAPRPEPRPAAAPFRPRVTLDDYLRRGQETRS